MYLVMIEFHRKCLRVCVCALPDFGEKVEKAGGG